MRNHTCIECHRGFETMNVLAVRCSSCEEKMKEEIEKVNKNDDGNLTVFDTGAYRDTSKGKLDYRGALSPLVLKRYAEYVLSKAIMPDGTFRSCGNWKKGFTKESFVESKLRHAITTWSIFEDYEDGDIEVSLCAELFNTMGLLHEVLITKKKQKR